MLRECVESISRVAFNFVANVVVVDNGSVDGSDANLIFQNNNLFVRCIRAEENLGFSKACNLGASYCNSEFILFLNPDACLHQDSIDKVISFMLSDEASRVAVCGVKLLDDSGNVARSCARFPSLCTYVGHCTGLSKFFPVIFPSHFMIEFDHLSNKFVDEVIGAFFFVRRSVFDELHGFDTRYFVYFEELDFALRAKMLGWNSYYLADASAYHKGGGTSDQVKAHRLFYSLRSRMIYGFRHFSRPAAWGVVMLTMLVEPWPRLARALLRRSWQEARDTCWGYGMLWKDLPATLGKGCIDG
ncbi:hypothetical protein DFR38_1176 [Aquitalea magnusonii]|uniref:Glycosyltransferase 2-like domain-containing protein n=2 Tax=Aquitalea magnusonii TaxID=332411 RepID=A0A318J6K3_9NEIS|nr:hypothetical protein DFR38_1176 [Aquitalea magnusonii]